MSWLLKTFQSDISHSSKSSPDYSPTNRDSSVKDDLSFIGESIGRQLQGVDAFLAPPPTVTTVEQEPPSDKLVGIRNDLVEIGGSFKTGLLLLSDNKVVTEISRFASSFLLIPRDQDHSDDYAENENIEHLVPNFEALKVKLEQNLGLNLN